MASIPLITADEWWGKCKKIDVLGSKMSYYDSDPKQKKTKHAVVFLHGNPASSYLWRNVVPSVEPVARCLVPDLVGHGRSSKLTSKSYRFVDHYRYLSAWMDAVKLPQQVTIVGQDWGSALGFHWCYKHRDRVLSVIHMESITAPTNGWEEISEDFRGTFKALRTDEGEKLVLQRNIFLEELLPDACRRTMRKEEVDAYREPYLNAGEDRRPMLTWSRNVPVIGDGPDDVINIVSSYSQWLKRSTSLPKLYIHTKPGCHSEASRNGSKDWPNQKVVEAEGLHFVQEDSPKVVGDHIKKFLKSLLK